MSLAAFRNSPLVRNVGWVISQVAHAVEEVGGIVITGATIGAAAGATLSTYASQLTDGQQVAATGLGMMIGVGTIAAIKFAQGASSVVCGALHLNFREAIEDVAKAASLIGTAGAGGLAIAGALTANPVFLAGAGVLAVTTAVTFAFELHAEGRRESHEHRVNHAIERIAPRSVFAAREDHRRQETEQSGGAVRTN